MIEEFHFVYLDGSFPRFLLDLAVVLMGVVLLVVPFTLWGVWRRRRALRVFGLDVGRSASWLTACSVRRGLRAVLLMVALGLAVMALLQPRCNPEKTRFTRQARDVAIVVDVSRSMLAADLLPNRLERAKLELERLAERLAGDRVGLIVFAGDAVVKCPLTSNYAYLKSVIRNVTTQSASQGGTRIGDAVRKAMRDLLGVQLTDLREDESDVRPGETIFESEARAPEKRYADIFLITDGEDHDSYPKQAAEKAKEADVGLYIVGLGSEKGTPIPVRTETGETKFLEYPKGTIVRSRLDSTTLMEMVQTAPRGAYLPAGTDNFDLVDFYEKTLGQEEGRDVEEESVTWTEVYQPFLLTGLLVYALYLLVPERPRGRRAITVLPAEGQA